MLTTNSFNIIFILSLFSCVASAPDEFCLDHFDERDCGRSPVSVFYYYKSGSRCEVKIWRGCSTLNKFPDYFSCLHFCVARIWGNPVVLPPPEENLSDWEDEVKHLEDEEIQVVDDILDDVVNEVEEPAEVITASPEITSVEVISTPYPTMDSDFSFEEIEVVVPGG